MDDEAATLPRTVAERSGTSTPRMLDCSFRSMGCNIRGTSEELDLHSKRDCAKHVELFRHSYEVGLKKMSDKTNDHDTKLDQVDRRLENLEISYDGRLMWKIRDYRQKREDARRPGELRYLDSEPFYTSRHGYCMCARVYLNGDGMGWDSHMSIYFVIMRGTCDVALEWPFRKQVSVKLVDQSSNRQHKMECFQPDLSGYSFQKPQTEMNVASGCPLFPPEDADHQDDVLSTERVPHRVSSAAALSAQEPPDEMRVIAEYPRFVTLQQLEERYIDNNEVIIKIKVHATDYDDD